MPSRPFPPSGASPVPPGDDPDHLIVPPEVELAPPAVSGSPGGPEQRGRRTLTSTDVMIPPPEPGVIVDPGTWFPNGSELEIEIGCGKGGFLLAAARACPERCFLGIEWANKYYRSCADRMARWGLSNVRILRTDAAGFVKHQLAPHCVSGLHVYHPDPWPKKRHHKRRLIQADFVTAAACALRPGAVWFLQTDHEEYFSQIVRELGACPDLEAVGDSGAPSWTPDSAWVGTNFEIKYRGAGRAIFRCAYRRS